MATITLNYDARNAFARDFINLALSSKVFSVEDKKLKTLQKQFPQKNNYTDAEVLVFNSMYNMSDIVAKEI